jgi:hypothetical protein
MASKRRLRRKACGTKVKYKKIAAAIAASRAIYKKSGEYVQAYKCKYCPAFHVGHWRGGTKW